MLPSPASLSPFFKLEMFIYTTLLSRTWFLFLCLIGPLMFDRCLGNESSSCPSRPFPLPIIVFFPTFSNQSSVSFINLKEKPVLLCCSFWNFTNYAFTLVKWSDISVSLLPKGKCWKAVSYHSTVRRGTSGKICSFERWLPVSLIWLRGRFCGIFSVPS